MQVELVKELAETLAIQLDNVVEENADNKVKEEVDEDFGEVEYNAEITEEFEDITEEVEEIAEKLEDEIEEESFENSIEMDNILSEENQEDYDFLKKLRKGRNEQQEASWKKLQAKRTKLQDTALARRRRENWTEADKEKQRQADAKYHSNLSRKYQEELRESTENFSLPVSFPTSHITQQILAHVVEENTGETNEDLANTLDKSIVDGFRGKLGTTHEDVEPDETIEMAEVAETLKKPGKVNTIESLFLEPYEPNTSSEQILQSDPLKVSGSTLEDQLQNILRCNYVPKLSTSSMTDMCWLNESEENERKKLESVNLTRKLTDHEQNRWLQLQEKLKQKKLNEYRRRARATMTRKEKYDETKIKRKFIASLNQEQRNALRQRLSLVDREKIEQARQCLDKEPSESYNQSKMKQNIDEQDSPEIVETYLGDSENTNTHELLVEHQNMKSEPLAEDLLTRLMRVSDVVLNEEQIGNMFRDKDGNQAFIKREHEFRKLEWLPEQEENEWKYLLLKNLGRKRTNQEEERWQFLHKKRRLKQKRTWRKIKNTREERDKEAGRNRRRRASLNKEQLEALRKKERELKSMARLRQKTKK